MATRPTAASPGTSAEAELESSEWKKPVLKYFTVWGLLGMEGSSTEAVGGALNGGALKVAKDLDTVGAVSSLTMGGPKVE